MSDLVIVLSTAPDEAQGKELSRRLVDAGLAACVTRLPGVVSTYAWKGKVEETTEVLLLIKTLRQRAGELEQRLKEWHPYEVPEIVRVGTQEVEKAYLAWAREACER